MVRRAITFRDEFFEGTSSSDGWKVERWASTGFTAFRSRNTDHVFSEVFMQAVMSETISQTTRHSESVDGFLTCSSSKLH
jgi:hypothetical protein